MKSKNAENIDYEKDEESSKDFSETIDKLAEEIEKLMTKIDEDLKQIESNQIILQKDLLRLRFIDRVLAEENREIKKELQQLNQGICNLEERNIELKSMRQSSAKTYDEE